MASESALPKKALEDQARRLLERARAQSGASVEEMVQTLGELQPRRAETRRSWYDWHDKPETISLLTGLAAIQMLGPETTMELLFADHASMNAGERRAGAEDRVEHLQHAFADLVAEMAQMRERVDDLVVPELAKQGALMTKILADMRAAGIASKAGARGQVPGEHVESSTGGDAPSTREAS